MGKNDVKHIEETIKKIKFEKFFFGEIKKEKSFLGKLLLQENYIFLEIISLLNIIETYIYLFNISLKDKCLNKIKPISVALPAKSKLFQDYTLGRIINLLKIFKAEDPIIINKLEEYNKIRNRLTHRMFDKYNDIRSIQKDAKELVIHGEEILNEISKLYSKHSNNVQILLRGFLDNK